VCTNIGSRTHVLVEVLVVVDVVVVVLLLLL